MGSKPVERRLPLGSGYLRLQGKINQLHRLIDEPLQLTFATIMRDGNLASRWRIHTRSCVSITGLSRPEPADLILVPHQDSEGRYGSSKHDSEKGILIEMILHKKNGEIMIPFTKCRQVPGLMQVPFTRSD